MPLRKTPNINVERDKNGVVRHLDHLQEPYIQGVELAGAEHVSFTPETLARQYLRDVAPIYGIDERMLANFSQRAERCLTGDGSQLRFADKKALFGTNVISYAQTYLGIPVWEAGVSITIQEDPLRVTRSQSSVHLDLNVDAPKRSDFLSEKTEFMPESIDPAALKKILGINKEDCLPKINEIGLLIYQYDPALRYDPQIQAAKAKKKKEFEGGPPVLSLPPVSEILRNGKHYVVTEVLFTLPVNKWGEVNWRAFIEVQTGSILYLRAFVSNAFGNVFLTDPVRATGDTQITGCSPAGVLDPLVTSVTLENLIIPNPPEKAQELSGVFVKIQDTVSPSATPPRATLPEGDFSYSPVTDADNFSAVNAYYHIDSLFMRVKKIMESMGYTINQYFDGTAFPVSADHRALDDEENAACYGNKTGVGAGKFVFGRVQVGCPVGRACNPSTVYHEFSHALLWDCVHSPNFGFAHSAGDSLAAILLDPSSRAPDRFRVFPWGNNLRRCDRTVSSGWGWGGAKDDKSYQSEEILATTLFRLYRSVGGDYTNHDGTIQLVQRRFSADYISYLIIRAIGSLATSTITPTPTPNVFAEALMEADMETKLFNGQPGGAFHKVIRWGFEKQGLYRAPGVPKTSEGSPPEIDVYINDGRHGEYQYQEVFWKNTDIWNRHVPDGGTEHETPWPYAPNYVYVRIKNRGSKTAQNVVVRVFHCKPSNKPSSNLVWPDDWKPLTTAELSPPGKIINAGTSVVVGPLKWNPEQFGERILAHVSADGDLSNIDPAWKPKPLPCYKGPIPNKSLVPFDNNIGQRTLPRHGKVDFDVSARKREFMEYAKKHGINYSPIEWGDWQLVPKKLSGTKYVVEGDDLHFINNPAMQQMWDDIRRTVIVGLDMAHEVLQKRLCKEITPEKINDYLEILNHAMPGGALIQEHMVEAHPGLVDDCHVRVFTGDDALADEIDNQYLIDINKLFPANQAEQIKAAIGKTTWQAVHIPTIVVRSCDGATAFRWSAMQLSMAFINAYGMGAGEAVVAELAYAAKHAAVTVMSGILPARRSRGPNNPGGLSFGYLADMVQTSRVAAADPLKVSMNVVAAGSMLYDQIWLGGHMAGGSGFTELASAAYTNDTLDELCSYGVDYANDKYGGFVKAPATLLTAKEMATEVNAYGMEEYEAFTTLLEEHFGGSQRSSVLGAASGITAAIASGNSQVGLSAWHLSMLLHKEGWGRLGFLGYDLQDQCGPSNAFSYQSDEGNPLELRGANYPNYAMNAGHMGGYAGIVSATHAARGDAFAVSPLVKVAFANPGLVFDFADIRACFGKGGVREFRAAGERSLVMPAI